MTATVHEQAEEAELHFCGLRDTLQRAVAKQIKRSDFDMERLRQRLQAAEAGSLTLRRIADGQGRAAS